MMDIVEQAKAYARDIFAGDASGHDFDHTLRVYKTAVRIAEEEGADMLTVQLCALLHDVDDRKISPETSENLENAVAFLRAHHVPDEQIRAICTAISQISFSKHPGPPSTLEGKCVQDADRLDAMGAIGIARTFAFGGSRGRSIYDPDGKDTETSVAHFYDKLFHLKDLMNTAAGKRLAKERDLFMHSFLDQFYAEWDGLG